MKLIKEEVVNCTKEISQVKLDDGQTIEMIYYISDEGLVLDTVCRCVDTDEYLTDISTVELVEEFLRNMYAIRNGGEPEIHLEHKSDSDFLGVFNTRKNRVAPLRVVK
jgi:hypothetical protein